jgi:uncharacterized Zn-finger protein
MDPGRGSTNIPLVDYDAEALDEALEYLADALNPEQSTTRSDSSNSSASSQRHEDTSIGTGGARPGPSQGLAFDCVCSICGTTFSRHYDMERHIKAVHGANEKEFTCEICQKSFARKDGLVHHKNKVHGLATIPCGICDKKFDSETKR